MTKLSSGQKSHREVYTVGMKKQRGFTLIEMLIVIAVIGTLASIVVVSGNAARKKARIAQTLVDLGQVKLALEAYQSEYGKYPVSTGGIGVWDGLYSSYGDSSPNWIAGLTPTYMITLPRVPDNNTSGNQSYIYNSDGRNYKLIRHVPTPPYEGECEAVYKMHPEMRDPARICWAYGYWTPGAVSW